MHWINRKRSKQNTGAPFLARFSREKWGFSLERKPRLRPLLLHITVLTLISTLFSGAAAPEKHLSVYSVAANYSLPLVQHEGRNYIGLLEPLGKVTAKLEGVRWRLRYNNVEGDFQINKTHARVQGRDADLTGRFYVENNRGLVPLAALASLLPRFLGGPVTLHEESGRLFIGSVATHFTAGLSLSPDNGPRLVFRFTAPVNPTVATEPGALRMTFTREPVVAPASPTLTFGNKTIPSAIYSESNGTAVVTVNASVPVIASFSSDRRTVMISPTASAAQNPTTPGTTATPGAPGAPGTQEATAPPTPAPPVPTPVARRYFAVVDASHGGDDNG